MANKRAEALAANLNNPNVQMFLDLISAAEGTVDNGYWTMFGGSRLESLKDHPRITKPFTQTDGKKNRSSAAGRYQFIKDTWDEVAKRLDLDDFSEYNQDLGALELIRRGKALDDVINGDFTAAVKKLGKTWASLPSSEYPQAKRSDEWVQQFVESRKLEDNFNKAVAMAKDPMGATPAADNSGDLPLPPSAMSASYEIDDVLIDPSLPAGAPIGGNPVAAAEGGVNSPMLGGIYETLSAPAWAGQLPAMPSMSSADMAAAADADDQALQPWEEMLLAQAMEVDADTSRREAIANFFDEPAAPNTQLPKEVERTLRSIVSYL